jgi:hypothetical protein
VLGKKTIARFAFRQQALDFLERRNVGDDRERHAAFAARIVLQNGRDQDVDSASVLAHHLILDVFATAGAKKLGHHFVNRIFARSGSEKVCRRAPQHFVARVAQLGEPGVTDGDEPAVLVDRMQQRRRDCRAMIELGAKPRFVLELVGGTNGDHDWPASEMRSC